MRAKQPRQPPRRRFLQHEAGFTIVEAMNTLFMRWFEGESWDPWRVILKAAFCLPMTKQEIAFVKTIAGDRDPPKKRVKGCWRPTWRQRQHRLSDCELRGGVLSRRARQAATGREIVIATNSYRAVRGRSVLVSIFDDCAFW